jgi:alkanesulfonate monooxygenase SsuD/methylene tetrahydromethanopterin reductase-like flavin-dependent oxidoreductase (luciferase family)
MKVRIGLGLTGLPFADAGGFWRFVDLCEGSDVDSLWQSDRLVSSSPQLESMSTMAALAGRTTRLKFGMSVTVVSFRDPLVLAKECATIDWLSNGRLLPAFGTGPEFAPEWKATGR